MKTYYLIYQITNKITSYIYIGKHQTTNKHNNYMGSGKYLKAALKYYGAENFEKTILLECSSEEEMNQKEAELVNLDFLNRENTYNIMLGGNGGWTHVKSCGAIKGGINAQKRNKEKCFSPFREFWISLSDEERTKYIEDHPVSKSFRCEWNGRHHSEDTKKKMSISAQGKHAGNLNSQFGKMWICNDETKESIRIMKTDPIPNGWRKGRICSK